MNWWTRPRWNVVDLALFLLLWPFVVVGLQILASHLRWA